MDNHDFEYRLATPADLPAIYDLAENAFTIDRFSTHLLAEKLFTRKLPDASIWQTWLAFGDGALLGFLQSVVRPAKNKAWLGLFATALHARGQGVATGLFEQVRRQWPRDVREAEVLALPGNYFTPGLDPRYTSAHAWLERHGFQRFNDCANLLCDLDIVFPTDDAEAALRRAGVTVRRAEPSDGPLLDAFFQTDFGADWRFEVQLACEQQPPALHLAFEHDRLIAFSAHSTQNREWGFFGPMGTTPAARGKGVGRVLLWRCLNDLLAAGHETAIIPWVGPITFYYNAAKCYVDRVFWRYRLSIGAPT